MGQPITLLRRFGHKGQFVAYPKKWQNRMAHTGHRRFDTSCDLLVGICACGERHTGEEHWILSMLQQYNCVIETHAEWVARMREGTCESV